MYNTLQEIHDITGAVLQGKEVEFYEPEVGGWVLSKEYSAAPDFFRFKYRIKPKEFWVNFYPPESHYDEEYHGVFYKSEREALNGRRDDVEGAYTLKFVQADK